MRALLFVLALLWCSSASAQQMQCGPREEVTALLNQKYQEAPIAQGVIPTAGLMQLWMSTDGSTWTITITQPNGTMCFLAAGESLELVRWSLPKQQRGA